MKRISNAVAAAALAIAMTLSGVAGAIAAPHGGGGHFGGGHFGGGHFGGGHHGGGHFGGGHHGGGHHFGGHHHGGWSGGVWIGPPIGFYGDDFDDPYDDDYYDYVPYRRGRSAEARCEDRFRSYEPDTGLYTGYDGKKHLCPYLR